MAGAGSVYWVNPPELEERLRCIESRLTDVEARPYFKVGNPGDPIIIDDNITLTPSTQLWLNGDRGSTSFSVNPDGSVK